MPGGFAIAMALGFFCACVGDRTPMLNTHLDGEPPACVFLGAALASWGVRPEKTTGVIDGCMKGDGLLEFSTASPATGGIPGFNCVESALSTEPCMARRPPRTSLRPGEARILIIVGLTLPLLT